MTRRRPLDPATVVERLGEEPAKPKRLPTKPDTSLRQELLQTFSGLIQVILKSVSTNIWVIASSGVLPKPKPQCSPSIFEQKRFSIKRTLMFSGVALW